LALLALTLGLPSARAQSWLTLTSGIDTNLRGISAAKIAATGHIAIWACGSHDVILRSVDDGATWTRLSIPGQPELDFRGIVAFDDKTAYLMSSGEGNKSKIHKTIDGGINWELQYTDLNNASSWIPLPARRPQIVSLSAIPSTEVSCCCKPPMVIAGILCLRRIFPRLCPRKALSPRAILICWSSPKANCLLSPELSPLAFCTPATAGKPGPRPRLR